MSPRPSKRRRLSPMTVDDIAATPVEPHTNGVESPDDSSTNWNEEESGTSDNEIESEFEDLDKSRSHDVKEIPSLQQENKSNNPKSARAVHKLPERNNGKIGFTAQPTNRSFFELQVDDLLREIKPKRGRVESAAEDSLRMLKAIIEDLPAFEPAAIDAAERHLLLSSRVTIPFPRPRPQPDAKYTLAFTRPSYVNVVGSYALKTATKIEGGLSVDLVLQMPSDLFTEKDYLNYRYFHKRAYYLACVGAGIQKSKELDVDIRYDLLSGNTLVPIIVVTPKVQEPQNAASVAGSQWRINILLTVDSTIFPKNKTLSNKNCVRPSVSSTEHDQQALPPTPFYNSTLRADSAAPGYLKLLHSAASHCAGFRDACYLGRVWLRQRGMTSLIQDGGFGHFEWCCLIAVLLQSGGPVGRPVLEKSLSSQHLFSATINFLSGRNLAKKPMFFRPGPDENYSWSFDTPMLFDCETGVNLLFKMTSWSYSLLQQEARTTSKILNSGSPSKFDSVFILKVLEPLNSYDLIATLPLDTGARELGWTHSDGLESFYKTLCRGLGDRVTHINIIQSKDEPRLVNMAAHTSATAESILVGLVIDPTNGSRVVDRGPPAEDKEAAASFQAFWRNKAELRRFKDGQILESVVWAGKGALNITKEICLYLANRHFGNKIGQGMKVVGNNLHHVPEQSQEPNQIFDIQAAYRVLESQLRSLEGLPLQIRQIQQGGSEAHAANSHAASLGYNQLTQVVIQFEGSGRWPDDLKAIQMTKIAFLLKTSELLESANGVAVSRVGIENEDSDILNRAFIDVVYSAGGAFRIRIRHDPEQNLIQKRLADKTTLPREREESARALSSYKRLFVQAPLYAQAFQRLTTRFTVLAETTRLVKAWFAAHLLSNHIAPEVIEIITARTFLSPHPWPTPASVQTGFLRTLLFLSRWNWQHEPFITDFGGNMKAADYALINTRFEAWHSIDPLMSRLALFVATDFDPEGATWTQYRPAKVVAGRMKNLAGAACKLVKDKGLDLDIGSLFKTSLVEYDFVLRLNPSFTGTKQSKDGTSKFKNIIKQPSLSVERIGYDPVRMFVAEMEKLYRGCAVFFYGQGADVIGGLWSPHTARRSWKVNISYSTVPVRGEEDLDVEVNKEAILSEVARLGGDILASVEMHS